MIGRNPCSIYSSWTVFDKNWFCPLWVSKCVAALSKSILIIASERPSVFKLGSSKFYIFNMKTARNPRKIIITRQLQKNSIKGFRIFQML